MFLAAFSIYAVCGYSVLVLLIGSLAMLSWVLPPAGMATPDLLPWVHARGNVVFPACAGIIAFAVFGSRREADSESGWSMRQMAWYIAPTLLVSHRSIPEGCHQRTACSAAAAGDLEYDPRSIRGTHPRLERALARAEGQTEDPAKGPIRG